MIGNDTAKLKFGASQDLQIYHDGSNSYLQSSGVGDIIIEQRNDDYASRKCNQRTFSKGS